jgi:hypothetical protein
MEPQVDGLNMWFERAMDRASQRFTAQARVITVVLSLVLVFGAHLDAIRIFQMLSSNAQLRAQLAGSADALVKQAEQLPRGREGARSVVPEVYRNAMVAVLESAPATAEQPKPKPRHTSRGNAGPVSSGGTAAPNEFQISTSALMAEGEGNQAAPAAQASPEGSRKERENSAAGPAKSKSSIKERGKPGAAPGEDMATIEAKAKASKAIETRPGFASREDGAIWLRATLEGDPAREILTADYEQEVNAELVGDADKLVDHSASIKRELSRTEFQVLPERWPGWTPTQNELPGLLVAFVFLCLGAPLCYNMLKAVASLRPLPALKQDK